MTPAEPDPTRPPPSPGRGPRRTPAVQAELEAIERRLTELTPPGPPTAGTATLAAGAAAIGAAALALLLGLAVALTADDVTSRTLAAVIGIGLAAGLAAAGTLALRRWQHRRTTSSDERQALLARRTQLTGGLTQPNVSTDPAAAFAARNARLRRIAGAILAAAILAAVVTTVLIQAL